MRNAAAGCGDFERGYSRGCWHAAASLGPGKRNRVPASTVECVDAGAALGMAQRCSARQRGGRGVATRVGEMNRGMRRGGSTGDTHTEERRCGGCQDRRPRVDTHRNVLGREERNGESGARQERGGLEAQPKTHTPHFRFASLHTSAQPRRVSSRTRLRDTLFQASYKC